MPPARGPISADQDPPLDGRDLIQLLLAGHAPLALWARHLCLLIQPMIRVLGGERLNFWLNRILQHETFHYPARRNARQESHVDPAQ